MWAAESLKNFGTQTAQWYTVNVSNWNGSISKRGNPRWDDVQLLQVTVVFPMTTLLYLLIMPAVFVNMAIIHQRVLRRSDH